MSNLKKSVVDILEKYGTSEGARKRHQALGAQVNEWHGGQGSSTYALGSSLYAGKHEHITPELIDDAVSELKRSKAPDKLINKIHAYKKERKFE
jgi:hypothetical protein